MIEVIKTDENDFIKLEFLIKLREREIIKENEIFEVLEYFFEPIQLKIMLEMIEEE